MSSSSEPPGDARSKRGWLIFTLVGLPVWIAATVVAALVSDPRDPAPILLTFAAGGAVFFGIMFGVALWQLRQPAPAGSATFWRRVARAYLVLGIVVTALALAAIAQAALGIGSPQITLWVTAGITFVWALAVPPLLRRASRDAAE
jgi:hypothetical protein